MPVQTMVRYLRVRSYSGVTLASPIFIEEEIAFLPLTREKFISLLRDLLDRLGYDTSKFSGHSFCIGAATSAAFREFLIMSFSLLVDGPPTVTSDIFAQIKMFY